MQHIEFFNRDHFELNYHRVKPAGALQHFIDFYWQTKFDHFWDEYPDGFSDLLFPNIGYTYIFNLGTAFTMQVGTKKFPMKTDGFLPRHQSIECFHQPGNCLFGIKFKVSPVIYLKKVNFSEYNEAIFPLSYLIDKTTLNKTKQAADFELRVELLNDYYSKVVQLHHHISRQANLVVKIIQDYSFSGNFLISIEKLAAEQQLNQRTLQRYFETCTGLSTKKTLQLLRIRKAVEKMVETPETFNFKQFGYYDRSHFYKHLKLFTPPGVFGRMVREISPK